MLKWPIMSAWIDPAFQMIFVNVLDGWRIISLQKVLFLSATPSNEMNTFSSQCGNEVECDTNNTTNNYDIGLLTSGGMLSNNAKAKILTECPNRPRDFEFNQTSGRWYNPAWEKQFTCLRYSTSKNGAYCAPCYIFAVNNINSELTDTPFMDWKNATEK